MVNINSSRPADVFTGAYNKRMEQNSRRNASANTNQVEHRNTQTAKDMLGASVEISDESKEFLAGVSERKAAQRAAKEAASAAQGDNIFAGTGDFKKQYLILSEHLYNNGFYDDLSDDEVRDVENLLKNITSGMDSINGSGLNRDFKTELSHEAAKLDLVSSVNALNYFAEKYVPENMRESFKEVIKQYESYNSAKVQVHKNIYDMRDESMKDIPAPNAVNVSERVKKTQEESKASAEIGKVTHTKEQEKANKEDYQALFEQLIRKENSVSSIFSSLKNTLVDYAAGGSKNSNVLALLTDRNNIAISNMADYWTRLL